MKATKNNGTFESTKMAWGGTMWTAKRENWEIIISPAEGEEYYLATFITYDRPQAHAEGATASWALKQLMKECKGIAWASEYDDFFGECIFPLGKDLNQFMKRPARETYNSR